MLKIRALSIFERRFEPSARLAPTDTAALRNCDVIPYLSSTGKSAVNK